MSPQQSYSTVTSFRFQGCIFRYSIPEEMNKGSVVGTVIQDLGLDVKRLKSGRARIFTEDSREYIGLNVDKGTLVVRERIDREELCAQVSPCSLHFQIILENPIELHRIDVEILDINDNPPAFERKEISVEVRESAAIGSRFSLESARDADAGLNTVQRYTLSPTEHFTLKELSRSDGTKYVEMVLQTLLDRELQEEHKLILTAFDGGTPQKSGTARITVTVIDANDNTPMFSQPIYRVSLSENAAKSSLVVTVSATDKDKGSNGEVMYSFSQSTGKEAIELFSIDSDTGEIKVGGLLDYEKARQYELNVEAMDKGGLTDRSKVVIEVTDINDNIPKITLMSFSNTLPENSPPGTVIAMINVQDSDSEENAKVTCSIDRNLPFRTESSLTNYYSIVTDASLDREQTAEYNITITAKDGGHPPMSSTKTLLLKISDINDHSPQFEHESYSTHVTENNSPSLSLLSIKANDADLGTNAQISYFIVDKDVNGALSSLISIDSGSGMIYATKSFDYEQIKSFSITVKAQDGGSPPLSSNATVNFFIQDQNDNSPQVLYPLQTGRSLVAEIVPRSADVGYLVTKVVAVDVDSGQNAWLSYKLQKATDRALFEVGLQNGEIRTVRQVTDKDAVKQKLTVVVEDNGQPSRSATVNINVAVADSFPEVLSEFTDFTHDKEYDDNLTFYLVLALAVVSFLFITSIIAILSLKCYRWRRERMFYKSSANLPVIPYYPPLYADVGGTGTLKQVFNYEVCGTADSRKIHCSPLSTSAWDWGGRDRESWEEWCISTLQPPLHECVGLGRERQRDATQTAYVNSISRLLRLASSPQQQKAQQPFCTVCFPPLLLFASRPGWDSVNPLCT
uniref:Cadherin domain-containing protein n=1 Tax=Electrophorus electricus TaxID=8005 RepID=A0AAY5EVC8_ELEEL